MLVDGRGQGCCISHVIKQKGCKIHQQLRQWKTIKECKTRETKRQKEKTDTQKAKLRE